MFDAIIKNKKEERARKKTLLSLPIACSRFPWKIDGMLIDSTYDDRNGFKIFVGWQENNKIYKLLSQIFSRQKDTNNNNNKQ